MSAIEGKRIKIKEIARREAVECETEAELEEEETLNMSRFRCEKEGKQERFKTPKEEDMKKAVMKDHPQTTINRKRRKVNDKRVGKRQEDNQDTRGGL